MILKLIVGVENAIGGMPSTDGTQRFSVLDFLTIAYLYEEEATNQDKKNAAGSARKCFSRLIAEDSEHRDEILSNVVYLKFPGQGQKDTPTMTLACLQKLMLLVGGTFGRKAR